VDVKAARPVAGRAQGFEPGAHGGDLLSFLPRKARRDQLSPHHIVTRDGIHHPAVVEEEEVFGDDLPSRQELDGALGRADPFDFDTELISRQPALKGQVPMGATP